MEALKTQGNLLFAPEAFGSIPGPKDSFRLVHLTPADFLTIAQEGVDEGKTKRVERLYREGIPFLTLPSLTLRRGDWRVLGHEGRHRARLLKKLNLPLPTILDLVDDTRRRIPWGRTKLPDFILPERGKEPLPLNQV